YAGEVAGEVPHGIQRMVEFARALVLEPSFLLLDEPAAGLTATEIGTLKDAIRSLTASGVGVLLIEHNVPVVLDLAEEVTVLHRGKRLAYGSPGEVSANPEVIRVFLGSQAEATAPTLSVSVNALEDASFSTAGEKGGASAPSALSVTNLSAGYGQMEVVAFVSWR